MPSKNDLFGGGNNHKLINIKTTVYKAPTIVVTSLYFTSQQFAYTVRFLIYFYAL